MICESYHSHVIRCEYFSLRIFLFAMIRMFCESCESMIRVIRKIANHANHMIRVIRVFANHANHMIRMIRVFANHANQRFVLFDFLRIICVKCDSQPRII